MKAKVYDIKKSESGKSDVITLLVSEPVKTALGESTTNKFYNHAVQAGTATVSVDEEIELDMSAFTVRKSMLTYKDGSEHESLWLEVRLFS